MTYAFDPELAAASAVMTQIDDVDVDTARARYAEMLATFPAPDESGVTLREELVPGPDGPTDVTLLVYTSERVTAPAAIYDVHGGGFILGPRRTATLTICG